MNSILVRITSNYGTKAIYPADDAARAFARIAGTRTLTDYAIQQIKQLGYDITVEQPEIETL